MDTTTGGSRHERQLEALAAIASILSNHTGQREMLHEIIGVLEHTLHMSRGTIMLLSPDGTELLVEALHSDTATANIHARYRTGEGITGRVISSGRAAIVPRVGEEPLFRDRIHRRRAANATVGSFICVPIKLDNEVVGTLSADIEFSPCEPLEEDKRVLSIVASMVANDVKTRRRMRQEQEAHAAENLRLRDALGQDFRPEDMIGNSKEMRPVYLKISQVAPSDTTVLIRGESGTGKELVAAAVHYGSTRKNKEFIKVNCAALNENLLESELFGHEKGSFTGAITSRKGRIEEAEGGTLFLDEIGEFSPTLQVKMLRVLQEHEYERVGSNTTIKANVRIVAATNRDLEKAVDLGIFRKDLYYRINPFPIVVPPLRERREDIIGLADHFARRFARKLSRPIRRISTPAISMMMQYHWPGNVRELENCIEHAMLVCRDGVIHGYDLPPTLQCPTEEELFDSGTLKARVHRLEHDIIVDTLKHTNGNMESAARRLGITSRMLRYKVNNLKIDYAKYFKGLKVAKPT
jgi:Nif-specific regulatory protein